jgi:hypothetical protein
VGKSRVRLSTKFRTGVADPQGMKTSHTTSFGFVSGHDFRGCGKTSALYQGTTFSRAVKAYALYQGTTLVVP